MYHTSLISKLLDYWTNQCGMTCYSREETCAVLGYASTGQAKLELKQAEEAIDRGSAFGRIAFSCPREQVPTLN